MDFDPDYPLEDYEYDTFDRITDEPDGPLEDVDPIDPLNATTMGMAFALADEIREAEQEGKTSSKYDLDENTDEENMRLAMAVNQTHQDYERLRPFEQYIDDICKGRRKLFGD
jgi:hypothetical protein